MLCNPTMKEAVILSSWLPEGWIRPRSCSFVNQSRVRGGRSRKRCRRRLAEDLEAGGILIVQKMIMANSDEVVGMTEGLFL